MAVFFLVPCEKCHVKKLGQDSATTFDWDITNLVTLDIFEVTIFARYRKDTAMFNWAPCSIKHIVYVRLSRREGGSLRIISD